MSASIPKELVRDVVTRVAPKLFDAFRAQFQDAGFDLGPMTPDLRQMLAEVDERLERVHARELRATYPRPPSEDD